MCGTAGKGVCEEVARSFVLSLMVSLCFYIGARCDLKLGQMLWFEMDPRRFESVAVKLSRSITRGNAIAKVG